MQESRRSQRFGPPPRTTAALRSPPWATTFGTSSTPSSDPRCRSCAACSRRSTPATRSKPCSEPPSKTPRRPPARSGPTSSSAPSTSARSSCATSTTRAVDEELQSLLEELEDHGDEAEDASSALWNATGILSVQVLWKGEDHAESLRKLNPLWQQLLDPLRRRAAGRRRGLLRRRGTVPRARVRASRWAQLLLPPKTDGTLSTSGERCQRTRLSKVARCRARSRARTGPRSLAPPRGFLERASRDPTGCAGFERSRRRRCAGVVRRQRSRQCSIVPAKRLLKSNHFNNLRKQTPTLVHVDSRASG